MITMTIQCNDGSTRVIRLRGQWSPNMLVNLAKDLEGANYKSHSILR